LKYKHDVGQKKKRLLLLASGNWLLAAIRYSFTEIAYKTQNPSHAVVIFLTITNRFPLTLTLSATNRHCDRKEAISSEFLHFIP
jgi:hypothetical protein